MKKRDIVNPAGRKGKEINERMRELMNLKPVTENRSTSVVELTKLGPDGKVYAIVRENRNFFIKIADNKVGGVMTEDFNYMGGLKNKHNEAYPTYEKAIKRLNLKFHSLKEAYGETGSTNILKNDNLLIETPVRSAGSYGFAPVEEEIVEDAELTEVETSIDEMLDPVGKEDSDVDNDGDSDDSDDYIKNKRMKISKAIDEMEDIIEDESTVSESEILDYLKNLSEAEIKNILKKKV